MCKYLYLFICLALSIEWGYSLTCYSCTATNGHSCLQEVNRRTVTCGKAVSGFKPLCSFIETYDPYRNIYDVQAGCQLASFHDPLATTRSKLCTHRTLQVNRCVLCETDYCNNVSY